MKTSVSRFLVLLLSVCILAAMLPFALAANEGKPETRAGDAFAIGKSGTYVIAANVNGVYYAMPNQFSSKINGAEITVVDGCVPTDVAADYAVTLSYDGVNYSIFNGTNYLKYASSTNLGASTTAYNWNISEGTNGSWRIASVNTPERGVIFRADSYLQFGGYAVSNVKEGSMSYYDVEILPVGTVSAPIEEAFVRVTSLSELTTGRYVMLVAASAENASSAYYGVLKAEDSKVYALNVVGTSFTSLPNSITASDGLIWTAVGNSSKLMLGGNDGRFLYNPEDLQLENNTENASTWSATYDVAKGGFYFRSDAGFYLSLRDDSTSLGTNELPLVCVSSSLDKGSCYFYLYKSNLPESSCAHASTTTAICDANCIKNGTKTVVCTNCNAVLSGEILDKTSHSYVYTPVGDGTHNITCANCDYSSSASCTLTNSKCKYCGWSNNTGCSHANTTESTVSATCTAAGSITVTCKDCGAVVSTQTIDALGHNASYIEGTPAGCTTEGSIPHYICTRCGLCFSDAICSKEIKPSATVVAPIGHTVKAVGKIEATCGTEGIEAHYHCAVCDSYFTDEAATKQVALTDLTIPALGHDTVYTPANPATCAADGNTAYYTCEDCGYIFSDAACTNQIILSQTVIPALDHQLTFYPVVEATCTKSGVYAYYYCSICDIYYSDDDHTEVITKNDLTAPALGHSIKYTARIEPGCTEKGMQAHYYCERCHALYSDAAATQELTIAQVEISPVGHSFVDGICTACGESGITIDENVKIAHSLNLASDISINYAVKSSYLTDYDRFYLSYSVPKYTGNAITEYTTGTIEGVVNGSYYYFTLKGLNALRMNDMVKATLHMFKGDVEYVSKVDVYSVGTYAYNKLNDANAAEALKKMCANLLQYGAAAQVWKEYRTDALVDANMTAEHKAYLIDTKSVTFGTVNQKKGDISNPAITWVGKALILDSQVAVKYVFDASKFTGDINNLKLVATFINKDGQSETATVEEFEVYNEAKKQYAFIFNGLLAAELRAVVNISVYDGNTQVSESWDFQADQYAIGKSGTLLEMCKALFAYSDSALAYFGK